MAYKVGKHEFHTQEEYKAALRDQLRIQSLKQTGSTPRQIAADYKRQIREQGIFFETILGKEFMADLNRQAFQENLKVGREKLAAGEKERQERLEKERILQDPGEKKRREKLRKRQEKADLKEAVRRAKIEKRQKIRQKKKQPLTVGSLIKRVSLGLFGTLVLAGGLYIGIGMLRDYISLRDVQKLQKMVKEAALGVYENALQNLNWEDPESQGNGEQTVLSFQQPAATEVLAEGERPGERSEGAEEPGSAEPGIDAGKRRILPQYLGLYRLNPDLAGWLSIADTPIDYPVMYLADDNDFYLSHNFDKTQDRNGLLVLDKRCDPKGFGNQILIHGHNMKSGFMFGTLKKYEEESYYREHPVIRFDTLYESREYDIISVFRTTVSSEDTENFRYYEYIRLDDRETFEDFVANAKQEAMYEIPQSAAYGDQLIMLSTCDYWKDQGRLVVVGRRR